MLQLALRIKGVFNPWSSHVVFSGDQERHQSVATARFMTRARALLIRKLMRGNKSLAKRSEIGQDDVNGEGTQPAST